MESSRKPSSMPAAMPGCALPDTAKLDGEYWRWLSFGFLHWDLTHLLLNAVLLLVAGPVAERRVGTARQRAAIGWAVPTLLT